MLKMLSEVDLCEAFRSHASKMSSSGMKAVSTITHGICSVRRLGQLHLRAGHARQVLGGEHTGCCRAGVDRRLEDTGTAS